MTCTQQIFTSMSLAFLFRYLYCKDDVYLHKNHECTSDLQRTANLTSVPVGPRSVAHRTWEIENTRLKFEMWCNRFATQSQKCWNQDDCRRKHSRSLDHQLKIYCRSSIVDDYRLQNTIVTEAEVQIFRYDHFSNRMKILSWRHFLNSHNVRLQLYLL